MTVTTDHPPKVGDVITTDGRRMKNAAIGPQGQYSVHPQEHQRSLPAYVEDKGQYKNFRLKGNAAPGTGAENGGTVAFEQQRLRVRSRTRTGIDCGTARICQDRRAQ